MCQAGQREKLYVLLLHRGPHVDSQPQVVTRQPADSVRREREKSVSQNRFCDVPSFPNIIERQKHRLESLYNQVFDSTTVHHGFPHFAQSCWFKKQICACSFGAKVTHFRSHQWRGCYDLLTVNYKVIKLKEQHCKNIKQDGSHEPECIHVLGLRVPTSAIGKRTFVCMHRAVHKETTNQHNNITTSTTKSQPTQQYHQRNEIKTKSPIQQHQQHSNITSTTRSPHFTLHTPHTTLYTPHSTLYTLHSTLNTLHFTLDTFRSALHTLHFILQAPHFSLYTPHSSLHALHSTFHHTQHSTPTTLLTPHSTRHTLHSTLATFHSTLHILQFTLHTTLHTPHATLHHILHSTHTTLLTPYSTLYTPHAILYTPHSTLYTPHSTLCTPH